MSDFDSWDLEIVKEKPTEPLLNQITAEHYALKSNRSAKKMKGCVCVCYSNMNVP